MVENVTEFTLSKIFDPANSKSYLIPKYQRGYSWDVDQIEEFWEDLKNIDAIQTHKKHFFGTVYTSSDTSAHVRIVDGQQRITTVVIFLICVRDHFFSMKSSNKDAEKYFETLQGMLHQLDQDFHPDTNKFILTLSRTNKRFFEKHVIPVRKVGEKDRIKEHASNDSDECLADAYAKLTKLIEKHIQNADKSDLKMLNHLVWSLMYNFELINVRVPDDTQAYEMFNLINNRGTQLEDSDLIKNVLFGELDKKLKNDPDYETKMNEYDESWKDIRNNITGNNNGNHSLDKFFYHYLIAVKLRPDLKLKEVFKGFKDLLKKDKEPDKIIDDLLDWSGTFLDLRKPQIKFKDHPSTVRYLKMIREIKAIYVYPVLMLGYKKFWENNQKQEFEALVRICFRYHIRAKSLGLSITREKYQSKLHQIVKMINGGTTISKIIKEFVRDDGSYPSKDQLELQLKTLRVINNNLATALLQELEYSEEDDKDVAGDVTVEHIMPKSIKLWKNYIMKNHGYKNESAVNEMHEKNLTLLGNQTLLTDTKNKKISNKSFDEKKEIYAKDGHKITNMLKYIDKWTEKSIQARQEKFKNKLLDILDLEKDVANK